MHKEIYVDNIAQSFLYKMISLILLIMTSFDLPSWIRYLGVQFFFLRIQEIAEINTVQEISPFDG